MTVRARLPLPALLATTLALAGAADASAAQRWASPASTDTSGSCTAAAPCRIDHAVNGAASGDEVVVAAGTYAVPVALNVTVPIDLHGEGGLPADLVGDSGLTLTTLTMTGGGTLSHLEIAGTGSLVDAATLRGVVADRVVLASASGDGAKLEADPATTVLRDSVVRTDAATSSDAGLKLRNNGTTAATVALRNVTVLARHGSATGVLCQTRTGPSSLVNVVVRGAAADVDASTSGAQCSANHSNFRAALSPGLPRAPATPRPRRSS